MSKAPSARVLYGSNFLTWHSVQNLALSLLVESRDSILQIDEFIRREREEQLSLLQALIKSRKSLATDDRDKIYALSGIASDGSAMVQMPNYAQSSDEISWNLTKMLLR